MGGEKGGGWKGVCIFWFGCGFGVGFFFAFFLFVCFICFFKELRLKNHKKHLSIFSQSS